MRNFRISLLFFASLSMAFVSLIALSVVVAERAFAHGDHAHEHENHNKNSDYSKLSLAELEQKVLGIQYLSPQPAAIEALQARLDSISLSSEADQVAKHYLYARLQQHHHDFEQAKKTLSKALEIGPNNVSALLLMASIENNLGNHEAALEKCQQLVGLADSTFVAACIVETKAQLAPDDIQAQYDNLSRIATLNAAATNEHHYWINEILADLALKLDKPTVAAEHLQGAQLSKAPVSYIALWADAQMALDNHAHVLDMLTLMTKEQAEINDALLLRLAMAEKKASDDDHWHNAMRQRIAERSDEHNYAHAAELARFYLYVDVNPQEATRWAKVNLNHAKSRMDVELLAAAESLQNAQSE
ncbi:tetratricopeptide repeat protein [Alteromonas oceanisediminis]|uniref:tetratricopeptide repeat protein n=1 Tax=Alteromonas oceanisediminis TaxID=2836180 RepID=UPI001BDB53EE|nr:hypothetical protein [Alteromonas oceanisediminis]MBT0585408.1 hypothetical protein [Alteromonas oceanisediminis]